MHDDFFRTFGIAVLRWQLVEHELYQLFHVISEIPNVHTTGTLYYTKLSFGSKLSLVNDLALLKLKGSRLAEWKKLRTLLSESSKDRNALAHLCVVADFNETGTDYQLVLQQALHVPPTLIRIKKRYDTPKFEALADTFKDLAELTTTFRDRFEPTA